VLAETRHFAAAHNFTMLDGASNGGIIQALVNGWVDARKAKAVA
jgi:hypothetical protein